MNQFALTARIAEAKALRYTPAGIPALDLELEHEGEAVEAGLTKRVKLSAKAQCFGLIAEQMQQVAIGTVLRLKGFLAVGRGGSRSLVLHITEFEKTQI